MQNAGVILQPRFHEVIKGDIWLPPGEEFDQQLQPQQQLQRLDPNREYTREELMQFPPEERQRYAAERAKIRRQNQPTGQPRQPRGRPGRGMEEMMEGMFTVPDADRPFYAQRVPPRRGYNPYGDLPPEAFMEGMMDGMMEGMMDGGFMQQPMVPGFNPADFPLPPPGEFDPRLVQDVVGWAHDDTAQPGKIYQYKVRYKIKNPVYANPNVAEDKAMGDVFALISADSEWSSNVGTGATPIVRVEVFSFKDGVLHSQRFQHAPGDVIGQVTNGIDFRTRFTVVDIPTDPRTGEAFVLLVDHNGRLKRRDLRTDMNDPDYRRMRDQANADRAAEAVAGANGGAPVR
jgi:hypothetical protein